MGRSPIPGVPILTGRKSKGGGFTRLVTDATGARSKQVVDLVTGDYRAERAPTLASLTAARGKNALRGRKGRGKME